MTQPNQRKIPTSFNGWLARLANVIREEDIIEAVEQTGRAAPSPQVGRHEIAMLLAEKYLKETKLAGDNQMASRRINTKYETVCQTMFKSPIKAIVEYFNKHDK